MSEIPASSVPPSPSSSPPPPPAQAPKGGTFLKSAVVLALGAVSAVYLVNPTAGLLEFIPDNIPFLGNLDEAGAVLLLLNCLRYFGVDLSNIMPFVKKDTGEAPPPPQERDITPK